ncbi:MAG: ATP-dependent DNA helicase UvrD2 [Actinobacteria bacterium]|nr:ATP-dependent DNA helicase UvrD2 [Actinomycetota bacterium]
MIKTIRPGPEAITAPDALSVVHHPRNGGAAALVDVVRGWLDDRDGDGRKGASAGDIAVLTRVNALLLAPHVALAEAGVAVDSVLRPEVLERTGLRAALAYLRIGADPGSLSRTDLTEVYRRPSRGLPRWVEKWFRNGMSVDDLRKVAAKLDDAKVASKVESLADDLDLVASAMTDGTTAEALGVVRDRVGLGDAMGLLDSTASEGSSHLDDLEALIQVAALHPEPATFEHWLRSVFHREAAPGGVTLSTVHRVKGREWDRVAVFGVTAGIVPHRLAEDVEEERRVLHVAITRARRSAVVFADAERPSRFVDELRGAAPIDAPATPRPDTGRGSAPRGARQGMAPARETSPAAVAAEAALRQWRVQRAKRDGVPAYVVFHDATLIEIARRRPTTLAGLRTIPGIGPTKLERYGDDVIAVRESAAG